MNNITIKLINECWLPRRIFYGKGIAIIKFTCLPQRELKQKFMHWDMGNESNSVEVKFDELDLEGGTAPQPAGQIFHMSRTGSTLVAEMCRAREDCLILSEPQGIADVLMDPYDTSDEEKIKKLRVLYAVTVAALGSNLKVIIKWPSWVALHVDLISKAFPNTPACFLVRDPIEVLVALAERNPGWMKRGRVTKRVQRERLHGESMTDRCFEAGFKGALNFESTLRFPEYSGYFVKALCDAISVAEKDLLIINYNDIVTQVINVLVGYFKLSADEQMLQKMRDAAQHNAKSPASSILFVPDANKKQVEATPLIRHVATEFISPALEKVKSRHIRTN